MPIEWTIGRCIMHYTYLVGVRWLIVHRYGKIERSKESEERSVRIEVTLPFLHFHPTLIDRVLPPFFLFFLFFIFLFPHLMNQYPC